MPESIFSVEAVKREQEQARLQRMVETGKPEKKVPMNITLSVEHKKKLSEETFISIYSYTDVD